MDSFIQWWIRLVIHLKGGYRTDWQAGWGDPDDEGGGW